MPLLKNINRTVAFLLEVCMLFSVGYYGFHSGYGNPLKFVLAIGLPAVAIVLWGYFAAPKSGHRLRRPYLPAFKLVLYTVTALLLYKQGQSTYALVLLTLVILNELVTWRLGE
ncbi:YrdB family protein [Mucilaginibacter sp. SP1R1]|uniref:YrdB family protein n=1 Tax=Mucilaginibacter sp. SP1R1 TaxID=2723091 RepID=UPI00160977C0|nr:YrdB family protein [Mucilaginibacter sp. SP1R1]MBB6149674.1 hypothetical protein [Mucilaginibacter sp. SP1R1]